VLNFNRAEAKAQLTAMGVKNVRDGGLYSLHMDDAFATKFSSAVSITNALTAAKAQNGHDKGSRPRRRGLFIRGAVTA